MRSVLFASAALALMATQADATQIFDPSVSSCTSANCSSVLMGGTVNSASTSAGPWTVQVFALAGECVRLDVTVQARDLETVVVAPNGTVWRNDDSIGTRPVVKFAAPVRGWYTVAISHFSGSALEIDFQLAYGRYSGGTSNANCAAPTASQGAEARGGKSGGGEGQPLPDGPSSR